MASAGYNKVSWNGIVSVQKLFVLRAAGLADSVGPVYIRWLAVTRTMANRTNPPASYKPKHLIPIVLRTLDVLDCFHDETTTLSLAEIIARTGVARASAFRIVKTLAHRGLLVQVPGSKRYRRVQQGQKTAIGYIGTSLRNPFAASVLEGLERSARTGGLRLVLFEPQTKSGDALTDVETAVAEGVRVMIHFHSPRDFAPMVSRKLRESNIAQIAIDIPQPDALYFGIDNFQAGFEGGQELGRYARQQWESKVDAVLLLDEAAAGSLVAERMSGAWYGIQQVVGPLSEKLLTRVDCSGQRDQAQKMTEAFLREHPRARRILIGSINDASGLGALDVVRRLKREQQVAIVGQDCIEEALCEIANPASAMLASVAHFPESYGAQVIELVLRLLRGEQVAPVTYTQHQLITRRNYRQYPLAFSPAPAETV